MWRFYYVIIRNIFTIPMAIKTMNKMKKEAYKNIEKYNEKENYKYVRYIVDEMKRTGHIITEVYGKENLPKEGGYMMYPNHQGKYDAYAIISGHENPCSVVIDIKKSNGLFIKQIIDTLRGKRLDKTNNRQAMKIINEISEEVKKGRKYILFPEGQYDNKKKNSLIDFKSGCFKIPLKSKVPIIPTVLIDTYKVYNAWDVGKIKTQVHFLEPIFYEEYQNLKTHEIAVLVKEKIKNKIEEIEKA